MAESLDHLADLKEMGKIRVISIPESDLVRVALTPKLLAANYRGMLELERSAQEWAEFEKAVEQTNIIASTNKGDHRWAVLFQSSGRTKHMLAVDRVRRLANLDGKPYSIQGGLLNWLKAQNRRLIPRHPRAGAP
jgi:hypothetical protein